MIQHKSPFELAAEVYQNEPCKRSFWEDLTLYHGFGYVHSTPDYFVMGRPVVSTAKHSDIVDPEVVFDREECDCWHIGLHAGNLAMIFKLRPFYLPLTSFEIDNQLKFIPLNKVERIVAAYEARKNARTA